MDTSSSVRAARAVHAGRTLAAASLGVALLFGSSAQARDVYDPPQVTVPYGDLNLHNDAGTRALYARLVRAARRVCGGEDARDPARVRVAQACRDAALRDAVGRVGAPMLTALHAQHARRAS